MIRDFSFILLSKFRHTLGNHIRDIFVERIGYDHIFGWIGHVRGECFCGTELHLIGNHPESILEGSLEDSWEYEDIIELIREVGSTGRDDASATGASFVWHDLRCRIRHCEDHRILIHSCHIRSRNRIRDTDPYEYIRSHEGILEGPGEIVQIGYLEDFHFGRVEIASAF